MAAWFLRLIGISNELVDHLGEVRLGLQRPVVFWLGIVLLVPIGFLIHRRQRQNLGHVAPSLLVALTSLRITILGLLVVVLAGPYLKIDRQNEKKPLLALLFDHSQSMQLPVGVFKDDGEVSRLARASGETISDDHLSPQTRDKIQHMSRIKLAQAIVRNAGSSFWESLAPKYDLRFYSFAKELTPLVFDPAHPELPEPPEAGGPATHLGDAVSHILEEAAGQQISGIVVLSDGENTGGRSLAEIAHAASDRTAPVYTVPTGSSNRLQDVAIVDVFTAGQVFIGDKASVVATVECQGFEGRSARVELREGSKLLDSKELILRSSEQQHVELTFEAKEPGGHYLTVTIPPLPEESQELRGNNSEAAFVRVSEEKIRVLYLEGQPRWDFRFIKNSIRRDHGLAGRDAPEPDIILESEWRRGVPTRGEERGTREATGSASPLILPNPLDDLAKYHTVILGDASPELIHSGLVELLGEAVRERGLGLIVAAGPLFMPQAFDDRFTELLPVRLRPGTKGMEAPVYRPFRIELTPEGALHESTRFYDDPGRNQNVWNAMPSYYWCAPAERPAPAATVLAWNSRAETRFGPVPLIVYHSAGKGKVLFLGTDSTWLWRQMVGERFFYKFWGQSIRFVARRDDESNKSRLEVRPLRAQTGEQAQIDLVAFRADDSPRTETKLNVRVDGPNSSQTIELASDPATKGRFTGQFVPAKAGEYRVLFNADRTPPLEARLRVLDAPEELRHPNVNRPALELLANTSGGRVVELPDLTELLNLLQGESKFSELHREATLWDNWFMLALLALIYSIDIGLRRLTGLS